MSWLQHYRCRLCHLSLCLSLSLLSLTLVALSHSRHPLSSLSLVTLSCHSLSRLSRLSYLLRLSLSFVLSLSHLLSLLSPSSLPLTIEAIVALPLVVLAGDEG